MNDTVASYMNKVPTYSDQDKTPILAKAFEFVQKNGRRPSEAELPGARTLSEADWQAIQGRTGINTQDRSPSPQQNAADLAKKNPGFAMDGRLDAGILGASYPKSLPPIGGEPTPSAGGLQINPPPIPATTAPTPIASFADIYRQKPTQSMAEASASGASAFENAAGPGPGAEVVGTTAKAPRNPQGALDYFANKPKNLGEALLSFAGDLADAIGAGKLAYAGRESPTRLQRQYQMHLASQQQANQMAASLDMELQKMPLEASQAIRKALAEQKYDVAAKLAEAAGNYQFSWNIQQLANLIQYAQGQGKLSDVGDPRSAANADSGKVGG